MDSKKLFLGMFCFVAIIIILYVSKPKKTFKEPPVAVEINDELLQSSGSSFDIIGEVKSFMDKQTNYVMNGI